MFFHALAIMHAPAYAVENAGALRQDWPRVPLEPVTAGVKSPGMASLGEGRGSGLVGHGPGGAESAAELSIPPPLPLAGERKGSPEEPTREWLVRGAALGRRVAALLDIETPVLGVDAGEVLRELRSVARYEMQDGSPPRERTEDVVLKARWGYRGQGGVVMQGPDASYPTPSPPQGEGIPSGTRDIPANARARWTGVPEAVWSYHLGGYQVLKKWLSYREEAILGRPLTLDEVRTFTAICRRIAALLALGPELDAHYRAATTV